jgi:maltose O-acetyltransferase
MKKQIAKLVLNLWKMLFIQTKVPFLRFFGAKIGRKSMIYTSLFNMDLSYLREIMIGDNVIIAKGTKLFAHDNSVINMKRFGIEKERVKPIRIGNDVFVGAGSIILPGVTIGENSIIGAGSLVTKSIPPNCVAAGNPAKVLRIFKIK